MILSMRGASYVRDQSTIVSPVSVSLEPGGREARVCGTAREAQALAMMGCALARATSGSVTIGEYDPRVQPVHCKRIAAYVPHDPLPLHRWDFDRYIGYRAALWNIDAASARAHAATLLDQLRDMHEAFAYPLIGALIGEPQLVVLDRPQSASASHILATVGDRAIFSTHVNDDDAARFR